MAEAPSSRQGYVAKAALLVNAAGFVTEFDPFQPPVYNSLSETDEPINTEYDRALVEVVADSTGLSLGDDKVAIWHLLHLVKSAEGLAPFIELLQFVHASRRV